MADVSGAGKDSGATKSKRPKDSAFKQQRLPAWQPILTAGTVLPTFFVIGVAFLPIGIGMLWFSNSVMEISIDYTECKDSAGLQCSQAINGTQVEVRNCTCRENFRLENEWSGEVFMYYGLENFYQNHRRYVKSLDNLQLLGKLSDEPSKDCHPFAKNAIGEAYVPCGAIANSMFNDVLKLKYESNGGFVEVPLIRTGIAWESDKNYKFKNPPTNSGSVEELKAVFSKYAKPANWKKNLWELDKEIPENNGLQNEDLIVWMRTAALPSFRKLYRKVNHTEEPFKSRLPAGNYQVEIEYNFEVTAFAGKKFVVLSTMSLLGGRNNFLGIAYIVVGCVCLVLGIVFLFIHIKCGKQTSEMMSITSKTPFS